MLDQRGLAAAGDHAELLDARRARFLDRVLDQRLVDHRQHFLGGRLGGGQETRAEAGDGQNGLAQWLDHNELPLSRRRKRTSPAGGNVALTAGAAAARAGETLSRCRACRHRAAAVPAQQHVARLVDAGGEPVRTAAVRVGGAHQPVVGGADVRLGGARMQAET